MIFIFFYLLIPVLCSPETSNPTMATKLSEALVKSLAEPFEMAVSAISERQERVEEALYTKLTADTESGNFQQQIIDAVMQSVDKTLKSAVSTMSERQDRIEETSFARLAALNNQISDLLHIISSQRSPSNQSSDNHFHFQDSISPASHESFPTSPTRANSPDLPCTDCEKVFPTLPNIHGHILTDHPTVTSPIGPRFNSANPNNISEDFSCHENPGAPAELSHPKSGSPPAYGPVFIQDRVSPTLPCNICKKRFEKLTALDHHIRANHPVLQCECCGKT